MDELHAENPNVRGNLFAALGNVRPTHLLDRELSRALGLIAATEGEAGEKVSVRHGAELGGTAKVDRAEAAPRAPRIAPPPSDGARRLPLVT